MERITKMFSYKAFSTSFHQQQGAVFQFSGFLSIIDREFRQQHWEGLCGICCCDLSSHKYNRFSKFSGQVCQQKCISFALYIREQKSYRDSCIAWKKTLNCANALQNKTEWWRWPPTHWVTTQFMKLNLFKELRSVICGYSSRFL